MNSQEKGNVGVWGEGIAKQYLEGQGFSILETNWHSSHREVDIIAQKDSIVVFVEVKTRTTTFMRPIDAVHKQKQKLLMAAANNYVRMKNLDCDIRFDIVSIVVRNGDYTLDHIENAFYARIR